MPLKKTSVTLYENVLAQVDSRGKERSMIINRDLDRYYESLRDTRRQIGQKLSDKEMGLILDNLNGTLMGESYGVRLIYANVEDAITYESIDLKWDVDGDALVAKLKAFTFIENATLADAAERWWNRVAAGEEVTPADALKW
jgi:hypothetical protein